TLATWRIDRGGAPQTIELLEGDLTAIPPEHAVDIVVVSAFPNDYSPVAGTVIGAFARRGISVERLAAAKEVDLRGTARAGCRGRCRWATAAYESCASSPAGADRLRKSPTICSARSRRRRSSTSRTRRWRCRSSARATRAGRSNGCSTRFS